MELTSYVDVLEQYLKSVNLTSTYEMVPEESKTRRRLVSFRLSVNDHTVTGVGKTKKKAKEDAAELMYNLLIDEEKKRAQKESEKSDQEPVDALTELCSQLKINPPKFEYESNTISSHSTIYTVRCSVSGIKEEVKSFKKDRGKKQVANLMLLKLKEHKKLHGICTKIKKEEMEKNDSLRSLDKSVNTATNNQLIIKIRNEQLAELLKKSNTAYELKMKPIDYLDVVKDVEGLFQKVMKEMEVEYELFFEFKNKEWICYIQMYPLNFKMKMNHRNKAEAGKTAIISALKYMHKIYVL